MALCRLDVPSVMLYGGSIPPGHFLGNDVTIGDVYEAIGAHATGRMSDEHFAELEAVASPGAGACGGQFTANTMAMAFEVMGISPMAQNLVPAQDTTKAQVAYETGRLAVDVLKRGLRPSEIITKASLENAIAGSRLLGRLDQRGAASAGGRPRDRGRARHRRLRPRQRAHAAAVRPQARRALRRRRPYKAGGVPVMLSACRRPGCSTRTHHGHRRDDRRARARGDRDRGPARRAPARRAAEGHRRPGHPARQPRPRGLRDQARRPREAPPQRARARLRRRGGGVRGGHRGAIQAGDVVVIRNEGPAGGPGMREMLAVTGASTARAWGRTWRCSPTGASRAPPTGS